MINKRYEISAANEYKKFNDFSITDELKDILRDDYYLYNSNEFKYEKLIKSLYDKNFVNKYDKNTQAAVFETYINNANFKNKALFIYSVIDEKKYEEFVKSNADIKNPNDYTIEYSIIDSDGTKVNMYNLNIVDISFVF